MAILFFGFLVGIATKFRTPIMLTLFMVRVIKWWIETHPHGREMAGKTSLDEEFRKTFAKELKLVEDSFKAVDKQ